jgi:hypothetical protein
MTEVKGSMTDAARRLQRNGLAGGAIAMLILAVAPPTAGAYGFTGPLAWWLPLAFCLLPLALSVHLLFDAALFLLAASHENENAGLAAIDDVLDRMSLRKKGGVTASLAERLAGCGRLLLLQRGTLLIAVLLYAILLLDGMDGGGA